MEKGIHLEDGIARSTFGVDIHSVRKSEGGGFNSGRMTHSQAYDIPLRALIARDADNILMAGRCISGDFHAHVSYRVTGNAAATGEAAGTLAALAAAAQKPASAIPASQVIESPAFQRRRI